MKLIEFEAAYLSGGPYDHTSIDHSLTLCKVLLSEDEDGWRYVRRGTMSDGDEQLALFRWEGPDETKNTG